MNETFADVIARMRRPTQLAVAFDYYGLEKLRGVELRMREWATAAARLTPDTRVRNLLAQIVALFPDEHADLLAERLQRAAALLDEVETPPRPPARTPRPAGAADLTTNVQWLKGVGPKRAAAFANLGVTTARDLLYLFPRRYVDRGAVTPIGGVHVGDDVAVDGVIADIAMTRKRYGRPLVTALLGDATGDILLKWFNAPYVANKIAAGDRVLASGVVKHYEAFEIINPEFEVLGPGDDAGAAAGIVPVYPLSAGLTQKAVRAAARQALETYAGAVPDPLPPAILDKTQFPSLPDALREIHYPADMDRQRLAQRRLSFEHLYVMEVGLTLKRKQGLAEAGVIINGDGRLREKMRLPFELTAGQGKALEVIYADLAASWPMKRLLQGDVGCGKTVVALLAMLAAAEAGFQAALMAPTEMLAYQHWLTAYKLLRPAGIECSLLSAGTGPDDRRRINVGLRSGALKLLIGTHAILEDDVVFKNLGLAVVDEQHRFGVAQRQRLSAKGLSPNLLVMTATPIPRTLALCLYGDLELTVIEDMPAGRPPRQTIWLPEKRRDEAFEILGREIAAGRQGYVVYPVIEESEKTDLKAATVMAAKLAAETYPGRRVAMVHGRLGSDDREAVMSAFRAGRVDALVATTVVEVGLDVANATVMIVEHAERYGLSQLHQLRGRVGRGAHDSYFIMIAPDDVAPEGHARLATIAATDDGFGIAEADLSQRGPGELLGTRQHGLPDFALRALVEDRDLFELARELARATVDADVTLSRAEHAVLRKRLHSDFEKRLALAGAF